ncbi:hypothetical protein KSS93_07925 [Pseudomonas xanthosomatis]|uniref:hypothetical protein n=1 Tax=Pseudomonas xanthosomatis TaxID=2842356 RepID=UPI001C3D7512|nr:hypothetical protein [Pseudomonas xanthosomatis]QXH47824.1 hypothetical protein KSS93_07925 [Pseudomonas xanthosomatis]
MSNFTASIGLAGLLWFFGSHAWAQTQATKALAPAATSVSKAMTIIFLPPKGQEEAFLNTFVSSQAAYMQTYAGKSKEGVNVINLIPTELGEPLIHLMIYRDSATFERAKKIFASREAMSNYIDGHVKAYGGYHIPKEYLRHTKVYMSTVLTE